MDDDMNQTPGVDPREMAERDQAAADRYHELAEAETAIRDGFRVVADVLSGQGFDEAAANARGSAGRADIKEDRAETGASAYQRAATAWVRVDTDQTDEERLTDQADAEKFEEYGRQIDAKVAKAGE